MPEVRLIDANRLLAFERFDREVIGEEHTADDILMMIQTAPTITPESLVRHGHWYGEGDGYADGEIVLDVWYCSECGHCIDDGTDDPCRLPNYCPNCGARMDLEE